MFKKSVLLFTASSMFLGGCAELNSIARITPAPADGKGRVFTVDAKQRHLIMSRVNGDDSMRVCAEAAPDVFSAYAASLAAQGDKSGGQLSFGSNETAATIERTQTINMLRESFYRTCERYLSGAISKPQFVVQAARDQRSMITILAIEQLTGVARGKSTIISPGGTAASVLSGEKAAELINEYNKSWKAAEAEQKAADTAVKDAENGVCSEEVGEDKPGDPAACTALKSKASDAKTKVEVEKKALDDVVAMAKDLIAAGSASTTAGSTHQGGGVTNADALRAMGVSNAVVEVVKLSTINEPLMFCLSHLGDAKSVARDDDQIVTKGCMSILASQANRDLQTLGNSGLSEQGLSRLISGMTKSIENVALEQQVIEAIRATEKPKLVTKIQAFEQAVGIGDTGLASACRGKNPVECAQFAKARDWYGDYDFSSKQKKVKDALLTWLAP